METLRYSILCRIRQKPRVVRCRPSGKSWAENLLANLVCNCRLPYIFLFVDVICPLYVSFSLFIDSLDLLLFSSKSVERVIKNKSQGNFWPPAQGVWVLEKNEKKTKTTSVYRLGELN